MADLVRLGRLFQVSRAPGVQADLLRVHAGLSGLLAVQFEDTGQRRGARVTWAAARRSADASGDPDLSVWVRARQAQAGHYARRADEVVSDLLEEAVTLARGRASTGLARAHGLRALLAAKRGDEEGTDAALGACAEVTASATPGLVDGWSERHYLWDEGYTQALTGKPGESVDRALAMYPARMLGPVTDLRLMQALQLVKGGDVAGGLDHAVGSLVSGDATGNPRRVMTDQIIDALPVQARGLPAAREIRVRTG